LANIKSAQKRVTIAKVRNARNKAVKSDVKSIIKKFEKALAEGNFESASAFYPEVTKEIDMATTKGAMHKNTASRKKSNLALKLNKAKVMQ